MKLRFWTTALRLAERWTVASHLHPGGSGGRDTFEAVFVELRDEQGTVGWGETAPSIRYRETAGSVSAFLSGVDAGRLSFSAVDRSMAELGKVAPRDLAAKCAVNLALLDGAARRAGVRVHEFLGLPFAEGRHVTSFSIGLGRPEVVRAKAEKAKGYALLKLKVGGPYDHESLKALREVLPIVPLRVDANEAWPTKEEALRQLEWLATDGRIQFVEQPMPAEVSMRDSAWLRARSPLPIFADESCVTVEDVAECAEGFHGVNVKLVKAGGISGAQAVLRASRAAGLQTMIGSMIESSLLTGAGAQLAALADHLDLDGNQLITNDPFAGVVNEHGVLSLAKAPSRVGLCALPRTG